jgi:hypothetical protein
VSLCELFGRTFLRGIWHNRELFSKVPWANWTSPITSLVTHAIDAGVFQGDVEPLDLLRALSGVATIRVGENWMRSAVRMVDLLLAGMSAKALGHGD